MNQNQLEQFPQMIGKTMVEVVGGEDDDEMFFVEESGALHYFYHEGDCCERVAIYDICGDPLDLLGSPILQAEEVSSEGAARDDDDSSYDDSHTWTFYKFATVNGSVTVRWLGESNGYYSEAVYYDFQPARGASK
jgi:hypothetical protein